MSRTSTFPKELAVAVTATALLAAATLTLAATARAAIDPSGSAFLAAGVKQAMQNRMLNEVPGMVITKVTCFVPTTSAALKGKCTAKFKVPKVKLLGVYQVNGSMDNQSRVSFATTSAACTDSRTGQRASCTNETSSGGGLVAPRLAESSLLSNGFTVGAAKKKAKTAVCRGVKSKRWKRGEHDDVFAQLDCNVRATDGAAFKLSFVVTGGTAYRLANVKRA
jgi:hypothetical protein